MNILYVYIYIQVFNLLLSLLCIILDIGDPWVSTSPWVQPTRNEAIIFLGK